VFQPRQDKLEQYFPHLWKKAKHLKCRSKRSFFINSSVPGNKNNSKFSQLFLSICFLKVIVSEVAGKGGQPVAMNLRVA